MTASQPTIIATSIGFQPDGGDIWNVKPGPAYSLAARLARAGPRPRLCVIGTAVGDNPMWLTVLRTALIALVCAQDLALPDGLPILGAVSGRVARISAQTRDPAVLSNGPASRRLPRRQLRRRFTDRRLG